MHLSYKMHAVYDFRGTTSQRHLLNISWNMWWKAPNQVSDVDVDGGRLTLSTLDCLNELLKIQYSPKFIVAYQCAQHVVSIIWIPKFGGEMASLQREKKERQHKRKKDSKISKVVIRSK